MGRGRESFALTICRLLAYAASQHDISNLKEIPVKGSLSERGHPAGKVVIEYALRLGRMTGVGAIGVAYKQLDTNLLCLRRSLEGLEKAQQGASWVDLLAHCWVAWSECNDKCTEDFRNDLQVMMLAWEEAPVWMSRKDEALAAGPAASGFMVPAESSVRH